MKAMLMTWNLRAGALLMACAGFGPSAWAAAPPNDDFANAQPIAVLQGSVTGSNIDATREDGEPYHANNQGGASIWWKITPPESGYLTLSTLESLSRDGLGFRDGQGVDTLMAVYTGSELSNLILRDANDTDEENWSWTSKVLLPVTGGTQYYIAVDGWTDGSFPPDQGQIVLEVSFSKTVTYKTAPAWQLPDLEGNMVRSSDFSNRVLLLNFWATWCPPCIEEIPALVALYEKYRTLGLVVVGISIDSAVNNELPVSLVGAFARDHAMSYPIVMTRPGGSTVETAYNPNNHIPTTVIIDRKNNIVRRIADVGRLSDFELYVLPYVLDSVALRARSEDGRIIFEWPSVPADVQVQFSHALPATSWNPVPGIPVAGAETTSLSIDAGEAGAPGSARFYRLQIVP